MIEVVKTNFIGKYLAIKQKKPSLNKEWRFKKTGGDLLSRLSQYHRR